MAAADATCQACGCHLPAGSRVAFTCRPRQLPPDYFFAGPLSIVAFDIGSRLTGVARFMVRKYGDVYSISSMAIVSASGVSYAVSDFVILAMLPLPLAAPEPRATCSGLLSSMQLVPMFDDFCHAIFFFGLGISCRRFISKMISFAWSAYRQSRHQRGSRYLV